jgi:hypothetical protein
VSFNIVNGTERIRQSRPDVRVTELGKYADQAARQPTKDRA